MREDGANLAGEGWRATPSGLLLPPDSPAPCVERVEFKVKVVGFTLMALPKDKI